MPASVELWNKLPIETRCINSVKALKTKLKNDASKKVPSYYYSGKRIPNILHTKLRLGCSDLNADKALIGISNTNECVCGEVETADHFLLQCGRHLVSKIKMLDSITDLIDSKGLADQLDIDINLLLYGSDLLKEEENARIFSFVQLFIIESKRFH